MKTIMIDFHHNKNQHFCGKLKINENIKITNGTPSKIQREDLQGNKYFQIDLTLLEHPEMQTLNSNINNNIIIIINLK